MPGYHLNTIPRGVYGDASKITEECKEFEDALSQSNPVMALQELSDMVGAIEAYLKKHHPTITLKDLTTMSNATRRAFQNGDRK